MPRECTRWTHQLSLLPSLIAPRLLNDIICVHNETSPFSLLTYKPVISRNIHTDIPKSGLYHFFRHPYSQHPKTDHHIVQTLHLRSVLGRRRAAQAGCPSHKEVKQIQMEEGSGTIALTVIHCSYCAGQCFCQLDAIWSHI